MKVLFLFANAFPFGDWEPYLETEVDYYRAFDKVEVFSLSVRPEQLNRRRPIEDTRVRVHALPFRARTFYAMRAARAFLDPELYREIVALLRQRHLTPSRFVQLLVFLSRTHYEASEIRRIVKQLELVRPGDQLVLYSYRFAYQPYLAQLVGRAQRVSQTRVARAHGGDLYERVAQNGYIPLRRKVAESVDRLYTVSEHGREYVQANLPGLNERVTCSHLGTIDRGLAPSPADREPIRILTCSSLVRVKRLDRLVDALAVTDPGRPIHWIHYGDGPLRDELVAAADRRLADHVTVDFRGAISNADLLEIYREEPFHALVNVSESEGLPVSMMEAGSFGIPVIATDVGGVGEIIEDGVNGILLPAEPKPEDLAHTITALGRSDPDELEPLRRGARRIWEERFRADLNYAEFVSDLLPRVSDARGEK